MKTKICVKCKQGKSLSEFYKRKSRGNGYLSYCKQCNKEKKKEWLENNPEYYKDWASKNSDKIRKAQQKYYKNNSKKRLEYSKKYRKEHLYEKIEYDRNYRVINHDKIKTQNKKWNKEHPSYKKEWQLKNKKHLAEYIKKRRDANPYLRLNNSMRSMIYNSLKKNKNGRSWEDLVGYTLDDLKKHFELQFTDEMNWENYGKNGWNIDHIIPLSLFNITSYRSKGFKKAWLLENLRPLWEKDNNFKRAKLFVL